MITQQNPNFNTTLFPQIVNNLATFPNHIPSMSLIHQNPKHRLFTTAVLHHLQNLLKHPHRRHLHRRHLCPILLHPFIGSSRSHDNNDPVVGPGSERVVNADLSLGLPVSSCLMVEPDSPMNPPTWDAWQTMRNEAWLAGIAVVDAGSFGPLRRENVLVVVKHGILNPKQGIFM
ncbi:hypothetical protein RND81_12G022800 [Saponaria officinalis]|uniref:Uncharacterized protein n=1 Tax=Saponaria officinalis TaxID=3572 RepID=A0AAW1H625_SAPOF